MEKFTRVTRWLVIAGVVVFFGAIACGSAVRWLYTGNDGVARDVHIGVPRAMSMRCYDCGRDTKATDLINYADDGKVYVICTKCWQVRHDSKTAIVPQ